MRSEGLRAPALGSPRDHRSSFHHLRHRLPGRSGSTGLRRGGHRETGVAQPVRRVRKSDGITTVQVKWRQGGRGSPWQSETFAAGTSAQNEARAMAFRVDVEEAGNRWPAGWTPGEGYLQPGPAALPVRATTDTAGAP